MIELLDRLYFPGWTATELVFSEPWGVSVSGNVACMYVFIRGNGLLLPYGDEDRGIPMKAGDHLILTRGMPHQMLDQRGVQPIPMSHWLTDSALPERDSPLATVILYAQFDLGSGPNPLDIGLPETVHLNHQEERGLASCLPLIDVLAWVRREREEGWRVTVRRMASLIFIKTLHAELSRSIGPGVEFESQRMVRALSDAVVGPVLKSMMDRPESPWTVPQMARMAKVSKSKFSERFRNMVGQPPLHYLTDLRFRAACRLLCETNLSVTNIASEVGYDSASSFSNAFKRRLGCAPADYRKRIRGIGAIEPAAVQSQAI